MRTRIKFCGITRTEDLDAAVRLGVDALGFVLVPRSRRYIGPDRLSELVRRAPAFVATVALFQDATADEVRSVLARAAISVLQFHGSEDGAFCSSFGRPYIKALPMSGSDLRAAAVEHAAALALLLDSHAPGELGGTGRTGDWSVVSRSVKPVVLAGGLSADNVGAAIAQVRPYAVDVSSGIESQPGVKDDAKMRAFVAAVRRADAQLSG